MSKKKRTLTILLAALCLVAAMALVGFALGYWLYEVKDNTFETGTVSIDLNGGAAVITPEDFPFFEPGMTVEKPCYITNTGTGDVYYKLYISDVSGILGDVLHLTVLNEAGETLLSGPMRQLDGQKLMARDQTLPVGETHDLTFRFHYPEDGGNREQGSEVSFRVSAIAVQTANNPHKEY